MNQIVQEHLRKYPQARTTTLIVLQTKAEKTKQLQDEILAEQARRTPKAWWDIKCWPSWVWRW